jgi:two-component system, NarL family, response regulator NreC
MSMGQPIKVHICDDHTLVRDGLRRVLEAQPDLAVTGEAGTAEEELAALRREPPDVLVLDVVMPGGGGIDALPAIAQIAPGTKILMLSMQDDPIYVRRAFSAGASGYLLKDAASTELVQAIREVAVGHRYLHPLLGARLATTSMPVAAADDPLSEREREVLRLLALGHTNQEIANQLFISVRTAETHRARMMQKLGLQTRAEIVRYALGAGELDPTRVTTRSSETRAG